MPDLCFESATRLAQLIAAREISSAELTRAYLVRIEQYDKHLRTFITVDAERALFAADAAPAHPQEQLTRTCFRLRYLVDSDVSTSMPARRPHPCITAADVES